MNKNLSKTNTNKQSYLTQLLLYAPASWALVRANEIKVLDQVEFNKPILDIGCGDGLVAKVVLSNRKMKFDWGIDVSEREVRKALKSQSYKHCKAASVYELPFRDNSFQTVFSNSVVEHLKDLDLALSEMSRVLKPGGSLVITVPSPYLSQYLIGTGFLNWFNLSSLAKLYSLLFTKVFKHYNLYNCNQWKKIFSKHSLILSQSVYYHSKPLIRMHEVLSYLSLPVHLLKPFTGHWIVFPRFRRVFILPLFQKLLDPYLKEPELNKGGSLLLIAKKK